MFAAGTEVVLARDQGRQLLEEAEWSDEGKCTGAVLYLCDVLCTLACCPTEMHLGTHFYVVWLEVHADQCMA